MAVLPKSNPILKLTVAPPKRPREISGEKRQGFPRGPSNENETIGADSLKKKTPIRPNAK
jgi:hypothetical protein